MTTLPARRLLIDLKAPFDRHWCGGDAFRTAFMNALSMSFPAGEQFFIDSVRGAADLLPGEAQAAHRAEVQGFIGQEATHRRIHGLFNGHLEAQGLRNHWATRVLRRRKYLEGTDPRHALAVTAAYEHFTAILSDWMLQNAHQLDGAEPRLRTMWLWHCAEECEHKCTAFDLYRAVGGDEAWRIRWMRRTTFFFVTDALRQTVNNLWRDSAFWRLSTWTGGARFLFGRGGLVRDMWQPWRAYFRADFHPAQQDSGRSQEWLEANTAQYTRVAA